MNKPFRRDNMEPYHTGGYLGTSRVVHNHYDVSTQADIQHVAVAYESEDELMGRLHHHNRDRQLCQQQQTTPHYSKQDIREQYCISERGLGALENNNKHSLFGCLSSHHSSTCSSRTSSLLTACVRQKVPSDENLYDLYRRHPSEYAPYPRRTRNPWGPVSPEMHNYDEDLKTSYFRRKTPVDASRYTWMPSDDESVRMEKPKPIIENHYQPHHPTLTPIIGCHTLPVKKHVSFARSHTMASFDDAYSTLSSSTGQLNKITRSQERLLEVRKTELQPITKQPEAENFLEKFKRAPMKTQATQTEVGLGRKPLPSNHINLSPRTIHRVKMVSQGAQTNGLAFNGRKLIKSYSEAGTKFGLQSKTDENEPFEPILDHEPLARTQSDEPPRSPFIVNPPPCFDVLEPLQPSAVPSDTSSLSNQGSEDSTESKKEIFIDFKPQISPSGGKLSKRSLIKTMSDGEILLEQRKFQNVDDCVVPEKPLVSLSHENVSTPEEQVSFTPYFQKSPIKNEGIFKPFEDNVFSSLDAGFYGQDSIDEEFHENIIYNKRYLNREDSQESTSGNTPKSNSFVQDECIVPSVCLLPDGKLSPFASNDSLANDARDQSDGIWNESQVTVLQVDSGTDNGTALSSSEMTSATSPGTATSLLTPSSRRKHLLMLQHQQRSSMDTEALDEEVVDQIDTYPRIVVEKTTKNIEVTATPPRQFLSVQNPIPQSTRRRQQPQQSEIPPIESPLPAVVPDLILARTDSCRTNTDLSESTTTDDYVTANSGTDSSRRSGSLKGLEMLSNLQANLNEGSFDSTKGFDLLGSNSADDMVVPSFSPPPPALSSEVPTPTSQRSRSRSCSPQERPPCLTPVPPMMPSQNNPQIIRTGRSTPSDDSSSSCGSYSVAGSTPDLLLEGPTVPSESPAKGSGSNKKQKHKHHHQGSSPRHASEDDRSVHYSSSGYYESPMEDDTHWKSSRYENHKRKKEFTLDLAKNPKAFSESYTLATNGSTKHRSSKRGEQKLSPSTESVKSSSDKPKRSKSRMRSPMQNHKKNLQVKSKLLHGPTYLDEHDNKVGTSDESSCELASKHICNPNSPRKSKKNKENSRRKSLPRSPVNQRPVSRNEEEKPSSLPGSLSRRKCSRQVHNHLGPENGQNKRYSPIGSPSEASQHHKMVKSPDSSKLKALSAESLRSVSPGSDSVFYSDPSSQIATDQQVHCLHCGKEVDIVTTDDPDKSVSSNENPHQDIVQPPKGFEDSPRIKTKERLFKKLDRRLRSEERALAENRKYRYKQDVRAKSEERAAKTYRSNKLRPMAKSTNSSQEQLKATDSSPSVLPGEPEAEDDTGVYDVPYNDGLWIYVDEREEVNSGRTSFSSPTEHESFRRGSNSSTESEQDFRKRYQAATHRMVHRKSCLEMYKRQNSRSFECDKTVIVHRESGEFGFRIHGSKPVVVSAIEPGTPAETSGLEVGDIVLAVNGISVLDKSHSEVVKIAHAGSDTLKLEVARTCYALDPPRDDHTSNTLYNGYLWKLSGYASGATANKWIRRWFSLKQNNCLYIYKTDSDKQPVGAVMLFEYEVHKLNDNDGGLSKQNRFVIQRPDAVPLQLAADTPQAQERWVEVIGKAISDSQIVDDFLETTKRNLLLAPNAILQPDCFGYLIKLGTQWKSWNKRYCVLKDACLYFYQDANAKCAFGVAYLHGYRVQQSLSGTKKHAFEIIPPDNSKKQYYFHTESDADRKRWIAALEYSIDRWLKIQ